MIHDLGASSTRRAVDLSRALILHIDHFRLENPDLTFDEVILALDTAHDICNKQLDQQPPDDEDEEDEPEEEED